MRVTRLATGGGAGKIALAGFSHGAQLAYHYASIEATRPAALRHVKALVPIDFYGALAPDQVDVRAALCQLSADAHAALDDGVIDASNEFLTSIGSLARTAPTAASPWLPPLDNRVAMLVTVGRTYRLGVPYAPLYHLAAPILDPITGRPIGLSETTEDAATAWLAGGPPHGSMREAAELEGLICGDGPQPIDAPLARITVPLFYLGAAGGVGELGLYSTTQVGSTDVTTLVVQELAPAQLAADFGHVDLLFAADAPARAWAPLAAWLAQH